MQRLLIYCGDEVDLKELSDFLEKRIKVPMLINVAKYNNDYGFDKYIDSGKRIPKDEITKHFSGFIG